VPEAAPEHHPSGSRVPFGVRELDEMLDGGLMPHRPYLIVGPAGTGKTTLALQFLCEGVRRGERSLYVTLEDPPNEVHWNHRALRPELDSVDVFDAIPDVMRYERVPFKDISSVREVVPFGRVSDRIRQTPEFTSVEVTGTALEQMLRNEVQKHGYTRLVIDSLTALQYFCMKGFDPTVGAQTFLRFLTELRTTTVLTVEAALEDVETPERMLARGEVHLFRWELEGVTVRAVGVEKFRGSSHDIRLHPYRIGSRGIDIQLAQTISRDTRRIVEPALSVALRGEAPPLPAAPVASLSVAPASSSEPLSQQIRDLVTLGVDVGPLRSEVEAALEAVRRSRSQEVVARVARLSAMAISLAPLEVDSSFSGSAAPDPAARAFHRLSARADGRREGAPPTALPPPDVLARELGTILAMIPAQAGAPAGTAARAGAGRAVVGPGTSPPVSAPPPPVPSTVAAPVERPVTAEGPRPVRVAAAGEAAPVSSAASPEPTPPEAAPAPRRRAKGAKAAPLSAHPPLPTIPPMPSLEAATGSPEAAKAPVPSPSEPPPPTASVAGAAASPPAPAPRRRRRAATVTAPTARPPAEEPSPPGIPKTRKRPTRRKKAPPVVGAEAEPAPADAAPAAPLPSGATDPEPSREGSGSQEPS
jgi:KaiC/GvpD/RAD55 family RecA-like ATPase